jgi:septation ring formation regulator EzrA
LTDSIMLLVEDIVDDIEVLSLSSHSNWTPILEEDKTQQRLRKRLGRNYDLYITTMEALSETLSELQSKLGLDAQAANKVRRGMPIGQAYFLPSLETLLESHSIFSSQLLMTRW